MSQSKSNSLVENLAQIRAWARTECNYAKTGIHYSFFLNSQDLLSAVQLLLKEKFFLESISGVDIKEGIMLIYSFDRYVDSKLVVLRVLLSRENKKIFSISSIFSGADWHERECYDFFGVLFDNHPNFKPLLLPDDLEIRPLLKGEGCKSLRTILSIELLVNSKL